MSVKSDTAIARFGKRDIVFGLSWFCPDEEIPVRKIMKRYIDELGDASGKMDICIIRSGSYEQFALSSLTTGIKSGYISAAAAFADIVSKDSSWLIAADIQGKIWICTGRDGCVLPGGDTLFSDANTARNHFNDLLAGPSPFDYLYAPEEWQIMGSSEFDPMAAFSGPPKSSSRIKMVSRSGDLIKIAMGGMILVGGAFMTQAFFNPFEPEPVIIIDVIDQDPGSGLIDYVEPTPWVGFPRPEGIIRECSKAILAFPAGILKTSINSSSCGLSGATAQYFLEDAFPHWIEEWGEKNTSWKTSISEDGSTASLYSEVDMSGIPLQDEDVNEGAKIISALRRVAAIERQRIDISRLAPNEIPIDARDPVAKYASASFNISTVDPERYAKVFSNFSGIEIQGLSLNQDLKTYTINGVIYARNQ